MSGEASAEESHEIVPHLIAGCKRCLEVTEGLWRRTAGLRGTGAQEGEAVSLHPASYDGVWRRARHVHRLHEELFRADRHRARRLCRELVELPAGERIPLVASEDRFRSLHLVRLLAEESLWSPGRSAEESTELGEVALAVCGNLDSGSFGRAVLRDLEAAAWGALGNGRRRCGDLGGAERALRVAQGLLREGSGDPLERARLLLLQAVLRRDQHRLGSARALLRRAEAAHGGLGEPAVLGRIWIERGRVAARARDTEEAVEALRRGLGKLLAKRHQGGEDQLRAAFGVTVELGHRLVDAGRPGEAVRQLMRARPWAERLEEEAAELAWEVLRLEGRIAMARGDHRRAEQALLEARRGWLGRGAGDRAAQLTFDLACLYLRSDPHKLRQLGRWTRQIFPVPGTGIDSSLGLFVLERSSEAPEVHGRLIERVAEHLERSRTLPW